MTCRATKAARSLHQAIARRMPDALPAVEPILAGFQEPVSRSSLDREDVSPSSVNSAAGEGSE